MIGLFVLSMVTVAIYPPDPWRCVSALTDVGITAGREQPHVQCLALCLATLAIAAAGLSVARRRGFFVGRRAYQRN